MDFTLIQSLWSIVILVTFLGIVWWAYSGRRKTAFDEAARLPFDDKGPDGLNQAVTSKTNSPKKPSE
jgi:cytochrome c oxidase cbb3-type subunit 4